MKINKRLVALGKLTKEDRAKTISPLEKGMGTGRGQRRLEGPQKIIQSGRECYEEGERMARKEREGVVGSLENAGKRFFGLGG